eukprot:m.100848 g.100848  ORF g.100848 m.100848 type:complete len:266 (+) comp27279_c0_seq2:324-1121(+)
MSNDQEQVTANPQENKNPDNYIEWLEPTEEELEGLKEFDSEYPQHAGELPAAKLRFLRGNELHLSKSEKQFSEFVQWREEMDPMNIDAATIKIPLAAGTFRFMCITEQHNPVLWCQASCWQPQHYTREIYSMLVSYMLMHSEAQMVNTYQHVIMIDMTGWGIWMAKYVGYIKSLVGIVQSYFPERARKIIVFNSPMTFRAVYAVIKPMLNKRTVEKVLFVNGVEAAHTVCKEMGIPDDKLPVEYGGTRALDSFTKPNIPGQPLFD